MGCAAAGFGPYQIVKFEGYSANDGHVPIGGRRLEDEQPVHEQPMWRPDLAGVRLNAARPGHAAGCHRGYRGGRTTRKGWW